VPRWKNALFELSISIPNLYTPLENPTSIFSKIDAAPPFGKKNALLDSILLFVMEATSLSVILVNSILLFCDMRRSSEFILTTVNNDVSKVLPEKLVDRIILTLLVTAICW